MTFRKLLKKYLVNGIEFLCITLICAIAFGIIVLVTCLPGVLIAHFMGYSGETLKMAATISHYAILLMVITGMTITRMAKDYYQIKREDSEEE